MEGVKEKVSCMTIVFGKSFDGFRVLVLNNFEWFFSKGHMEGDEIEVQTAKRELSLEAGVRVCDDECFGKVCEYKFYFDGEKAIKVINVYGFVISSICDIVVNREEGFIFGKWLLFAEAMKILFRDDAREALSKCMVKLKELGIYV